MSFKGASKGLQRGFKGASRGLTIMKTSESTEGLEGLEGGGA